MTSQNTAHLDLAVLLAFQSSEKEAAVFSYHCYQTGVLGFLQTCAVISVISHRGV